eukprot:TRINITY_DN10713_c0_g6_i1.p2 TRINITY_DN10713_c0_g6~~TRINITY_DN10713_c0_g6_i1.p2  ORF type:complete len:145 (+),score=40.64 TRINITY_DN10713_c0_g6_i1:71-505(+)
MYNANKETKQKIAKKFKEESAKRKQEANACFTRSKSKRIVESKKRLQVDNIFKALDGDNDGFISFKCIDIDKFSLEMINIFTPIFKEMQGKDLKLSRDDFMRGALKLYDSVSLPERKTLLGFGEAKLCEETAKFSFKVCFEGVA